jgi:glucitol/sorbitol PTS system EIIB component
MTTTDTNEGDGPEYRTVFVRAGRNGWGDGLELTPTPEKNKVISVTGGGVHAVAQRIAELSGAEAVDGFRTHVPDDQVLAAVINCGGTARIGVYPRKRIPTVDVYPGEPGGPLAQFITEDIFVSAVGPDEVSLRETVSAGAATGAGTAAAAGVGTAPGGRTTGGPGEGGPTAGPLPSTPDGGGAPGPKGIFVRFGSAVGYIINTFLAAARQSINLTLNTILPFMAYVSLLLGFVIYTGVATAIGNLLTPLSSNPFGLIVIGVIVALPFLSPILGPGAAVAQIVGVLMGTQIATGALPVQYALPTLFAIDGQVGCDFIPVGLGLGEAKVETVEIGTPAVLFSRLITSPLAVVIAYLASFGL